MDANVETAIALLNYYLEMGKMLPYVRKPLSWALHRTWMDMDREEEPRRDDEEVNEIWKAKT